MRSVVILCFLGCLAACVCGQAMNYLMASYGAAMNMKSNYDYEVAYFREDLTNETEYIGYYYTKTIADGLALVSTPAQGAAISVCARITENECRLTIDFMDDYILAADRASNRLHLTVIEQLSKQNIKESDLELFYYYHNYLMEEAYEHFTNYYEDMLAASIMVFFDFAYIYNDLYDCIAEAMLL